MQDSSFDMAENEKLPNWYKSIVIARALWISFIISFFFYCLWKLDFALMKKEVIPVTLLLLPVMIYYVVQAIRENQLCVKSRKLKFFKAISILINLEFLRFGYADILPHFKNLSSLSIILVCHFYILVIVVAFIDAKYLFEHYNK